MYDEDLSSKFSSLFRNFEAYLRRVLDGGKYSQLEDIQRNEISRDQQRASCHGNVETELSQPCPSRRVQTNERFIRPKTHSERRHIPQKNAKTSSQVTQRSSHPNFPLFKRQSLRKDSATYSEIRERHVNPEIYIDVVRLQKDEEVNRLNVYEKRLKDNVMKREQWLKAETLRRQTQTEWQAKQAFVSQLTEEVERIKRDREVREKLNDCLQKLYVQNVRQLREQQHIYHSRQRQGRHPRREVRVHFDKTAMPEKSEPTYAPTFQKLRCPIQSENQLVVGYFLGANSIPFTTRVEGRRITLGQFKALISKKGSYKYFFKKHSTEFGTEAVFEEINDDKVYLPLWEGKVYAIVETK